MQDETLNGSFDLDQSLSANGSIASLFVIAGRLSMSASLPKQLKYCVDVKGHTQKSASNSSEKGLNHESSNESDCRSLDEIGLVGTLRAEGTGSMVRSAQLSTYSFDSRVE
jgi:hypothetical protein